MERRLQPAPPSAARRNRVPRATQAAHPAWNAGFSRHRRAQRGETAHRDRRRQHARLGTPASAGTAECSAAKPRTATDAGGTPGLERRPPVGIARTTRAKERNPRRSRSAHQEPADGGSDSRRPVATRILDAMPASRSPTDAPNRLCATIGKRVRDRTPIRALNDDAIRDNCRNEWYKRRRESRKAQPERASPLLGGERRSPSIHSRWLPPPPIQELGFR